MDTMEPIECGVTQRKSRCHSSETERSSPVSTSYGGSSQSPRDNGGTSSCSDARDEREVTTIFSCLFLLLITPHLFLVSRENRLLACSHFLSLSLLSLKRFPHLKVVRYRRCNLVNTFFAFFVLFVFFCIFGRCGARLLV